ncbi:MAG: hypothetical protein LC620_05785 [Halobacteriales archaeon]|nr:hypothetical protein [Halobacteriales archaeon]
MKPLAPSSSASDRVAASLLAKARSVVDTDDLGARLLLAAAVTRVAERAAVRPIVTGGTALDFYVARATKSRGYPPGWEVSRDVDVVAFEAGGGAGTRRLQEAVVGGLGGRVDSASRDADGREMWGRGMTIPGLPIGLEVVGDELHLDPRGEHVTTVEVEGQPAYLRGPEDVLVSYAESGWDTWNAREWERALAVWRAMREDLDVEYLRRQAATRRMSGVLREVMEQRPLVGPRRAMF